MKAILSTAAFIAAYDTWLIRSGRDSISREFGTAARAHPLLVSSLVVYLVGHLYGVLPGRLDVLRAYGVAASRSS